MVGTSESFFRVSNKIKREMRPVAVIAYGGKIKTMIAADLPKSFNIQTLVGVYDATKSTFCEKALDDDLCYFEQKMVAA